MASRAFLEAQNPLDRPRPSGIAGGGWRRLPGTVTGCRTAALSAEGVPLRLTLVLRLESQNS